jgi:hypothetical protein
MASERPAIIGFCEARARPASIFHRLCWDLLPYWQATKPKFEIALIALQDMPSEDYLYSLEYYNGEKYPPQQIHVTPMKQGEKRSFTIGDMFLMYTGDTFLIMCDAMEKKYESVYVFHTTSRTWLALAILAGFLAGVFSTLGVWLFN